MQIPTPPSYTLAQILLTEPPDIWPEWGISEGVGTASAPARNWVWFPRLAKGEITVLMGDPVSPYRLVGLDIAARLSAGLGWPDNAAGLESGRVLICTNHRSCIASDILPALRAAGANLASIDVVCAPDCSSATLAAAKAPYDLLIIMWPRLPGSGDSPRTSSPDPLGTLCERLSAILGPETPPAVLIVTEPKRAGKTVERGQATVAGQAAVSTAFMTSRDRSQDGAQRHILLTAKATIPTQTPDLAFDLQHVSAHHADLVIWHGPVTPSGPGRPSKALLAAVALLEAILAGGPQSANMVRARAEAAGISKRTLDRAKTSLGVKAAGGPGSTWCLDPIAQRH